MTHTLEELFEIAQQYGNISLFQNNTERTFNIDISFMTIKNTQLEARSGFRHKSIREALISAIKKAEEIINSLSTTTAKEYTLLN